MNDPDKQPRTPITDPPPPPSGRASASPRGGVLGRLCLMCGEPLPPLRWWQRNWFLEPPPYHDPRGPQGEQCKIGLMRRLGIVEEQ